MLKLSLDIKCKKKFATESGTQKTAVEIQRAFLYEVKQNLQRSWMPEWAPKVCERWDDVLTKLETGAPESVSRCLDWAIKYRLFCEYCTRKNLVGELLSGNLGGAFIQDLRGKLCEID
ncbi:MAG: proteasome accessory factor PafA2 family protein, partial [Proteobacteria bacterium]|nr:proteasome accessory factor PafA2 family protein [Pseudomonadota bacterium]